MSLRVFTIILSIILFAGVQVGTYVGLERHSEESFSSSEFQNRIYITSPFEEDALEKHQSLWPRYFSENKNPQAHLMPGFYSEMAMDSMNLGISNRDLSLSRKWSVLTNTLHRESLEEALYGAALKAKSFRQALHTGPGSGVLQDCHVLLRERAFRIAQFESRFIKDAVDYLEACEAESSVSTLFLRYQIALSKELNGAEEILSKLSSMSEDPKLGYKRHLAARLGQLVRFTLQHRKN